MPNVQMFLAWYLNLKRKNVHEMMRPGYPCRLFVDVDDPKKSPDFDIFVKRLVDTIQRFVLQDFNIKDAGAFHLQAHREDKKSLHIVFEHVCFSGYELIKDFMQKVFDAVDQDDRLDMKVYSATTPRRLRIAYSTGYNMDNPLVPADPACGDDRSTVLLRSLLTVNLSKQLIRSTSGSIPRSVSTPVVTDNDEPVDRIFEWLKMYYSLKQERVYKHHFSPDLSVININPPLFCRVKGDFHTSQSMCFYIQFHGMRRVTGYFRCADSTCSHVHTPYEEILDDIAFPL